MLAALPEHFEHLGHVTYDYDREVLADLVLSSGAREVIEVGAYVGLTTLAMAQPGVTVHAIDTWLGSEGEEIAGSPSAASKAGELNAFPVFCRNVREKLFRQIWPHIGSSEFYLSIWPHQVDLVFLDANHSYEGISQDLQWARHIKPGGLLCGHDYYTFEGVTQAIDELQPDGIAGTIWWKQI